MNTSCWIQSRDGKIIDLLHPVLKPLKIEEVAHSLARINRFTGHTRSLSPYNVAQHSVLVCRHLPNEFKYAGLMHDAHEVSVGDIASPIKWALEELGGGAAFYELDRRMSKAFRKRFKVHTSEESRLAVREQDLRALVTERRDLMGDVQARPWKFSQEPWPERIVPWSIQQSEQIFLDEYARWKDRPWR
jgi:5'-nucleotidase